jgi:rod shape-determining protein MreC
VIQLINDPSSTVGAMVRRTRIQGVVEGEASGSLRYKYLARESGGVQAGDVIVTSGLGGVFPKGLPVGRVSRVEERTSGLFQYAWLSPAVDLSRVEEVLFLVERSEADLEAFFLVN